MTVKELREHLQGLPEGMDGLPVVAEVPFDSGWSSTAGVVDKVEGERREEEGFYSPTGDTRPYLLLSASKGCG